MTHKGHEGEISKVSFNPQGSKIITASVDRTARIWNSETGEELQVLDGMIQFISITTPDHQALK